MCLVPVSTASRRGIPLPFNTEQRQLSPMKGYDLYDHGCVMIRTLAPPLISLSRSSLAPMGGRAVGLS